MKATAGLELHRYPSNQSSQVFDIRSSGNSKFGDIVRKPLICPLSDTENSSCTKIIVRLYLTAWTNFLHGSKRNAGG